MRLTETIKFKDILAEFKRQNVIEKVSAKVFIDILCNRIQELRIEGKIVDFGEANNLSVKNIGRFDEFEYSLPHTSSDLKMYFCAYAAGCPSSWIYLYNDDDWIFIKEFTTSMDLTDAQTGLALFNITVLQVMECLFFTSDSEYSFEWTKCVERDSDFNLNYYFAKPLITKREVESSNDSITKLTSKIENEIKEVSSGKYFVSDMETLDPYSSSQIVTFTSNNEDYFCLEVFANGTINSEEEEFPDDLIEFTWKILGN